MFIVMNCLGLPFNGKTFHHQSLGGSESAAYYMARGLAAAGHRVTMFTSMEAEECEVDGVRYIYAGPTSQEAPLGKYFSFYAENTPHDVLIAQRSPVAFSRRYASKLNLWWLHDLATVRLREVAQAQMWNVDGILCVSYFHRQQLIDTWHMDEDFIHVIRNGVDLDAVECGYTYPIEKIDGVKDLLYTSRPERGLDHLVAANGIMDRLGDGYRLHVCGYENAVPQLEGFYRFTRNRIESLPNAVHHGALTKEQLYSLMGQCDALVYPTPSPMSSHFEEVSCITAMEAAATGLPFIASRAGALPETCDGAGAFLVPLGDDGLPNLERFVKAIRRHAGSDNLARKQVEASRDYTWNAVVDRTLDVIGGLFNKFRGNTNAMALHRLRQSDIYALDREFNRCDGGESQAGQDQVHSSIQEELESCYDFAFGGSMGDHYRRYYEYERSRGVEYGPEDVSGNLRFEHVAKQLAQLPDQATVLDYGCAHGHYTVNLAKRYPRLRFVGVDLVSSNIEKARAWQKDEGLTNIEFYAGSINPHGFSCDEECDFVFGGFDAVIAAEVLEHVPRPDELSEALLQYLNFDGLAIFTVPFGPWEAQGYEEHYPWRAHLWHFDREDLSWLWGHNDGFQVAVAPAGHTDRGEVLGSHIVTFTRNAEKPGVVPIDDSYFYHRPAAPEQTVSVCLIVRNAAEDILRCLNSVRDVATEIVIGVDATSDDTTMAIIDDFCISCGRPIPLVRSFTIDSPVETGFDAARNKVIGEASCDWVLWLDHDEELVGGENLHRYLRHNQFKGYALPQHHMAVDPLGCMKTDYPCRLFRNHNGVRFFGVVHEHPERQLNEGVGRTMVLSDVVLMHDGYHTPSVRQDRFMRNIRLMRRDRECWPERYLGKFLWLRDICQMIGTERLDLGGFTSSGVAVDEGIALWRELLEARQVRLVLDAVEWYHFLSDLTGGSHYTLVVDASAFGEPDEQPRMIRGAFAHQDDYTALFNLLLADKTGDFNSRYLS